MGIIVIILCIFVFFYLIGCFSHGNGCHAKYKAGTILTFENMTAGDKLDEIELQNVSMRLNPGESCYFEGEGFSYHSKDIIVGYTRSSYGSSMRVVKGYSIHRSNGQSNAIRKTVRTEYPGRLYITNERIVFLAERYGFDIEFNKLSNITMYNKYLEVFSGSKFFRVYTPHCVFIRDLITLMNICYKEQYHVK